MSRKPSIRRPTPEEDAEIQRGIEADPDNPEWTGEDFGAARPAREMVPEMVAEQARRRRGAQKAPTKELVALRLDRDLLAQLRAGGKGWQSRVNETLRKAVLG